MPEYIKESQNKNIVFKLLDMNSYEEVLIWKQYGLNETINDENNQPIKFPLKDNSIKVKGIDGMARNFHEMIGLPRQIFTQLYPNLNIQKKVQRLISINGVEYYYKFTLTANKKLNEQIKTVQNLGKDPLNVEFRQEYSPNVPAAERYSITIESVNDSPQGQSTTQQPNAVSEEVSRDQTKTTSFPPPTASPQANVPMGFRMTEKEQEIYQALLGLPQKVEMAAFEQVFKSNGVEDKERIEQVYKLYETLRK